MKRNLQTTSLKYVHECEMLGYQAEIRVLIAIHPGDPGDYVTPPTPDEYELLDVEAETITCENYSHIFGPKDTPADAALADIVEAEFRNAYETDDAIRENIEFDAAQKFAADDCESAARLWHLKTAPAPQFASRPF